MSAPSEQTPVTESAPPKGERTGAGAPSIGLAPAEAQVLALQRQMGNRAVNHLLRSPQGARLLQRRRLPDPKDIAALDKGTAGMLRVEVRDTGVGISADAQQKVFEKFIQADQSASRARQGW